MASSVRSPVPPSLASVLALAGFRGVVEVERLDGQPMTPEQADLARGIVDLHETDVSNEDLSRAVKTALASRADPAARRG